MGKYGKKDKKLPESIELLIVYGELDDDIVERILKGDKIDLKGSGTIRVKSPATLEYRDRMIKILKRHIPDKRQG
jgi:hypothetical protein